MKNLLSLKTRAGSGKKQIICIGLSLALMAGCATGPKMEIPERPRISANYEAMLMKSGPEVCREAQKHEIEWHGTYDKMLNRIKQ